MGHVLKMTPMRMNFLLVLLNLAVFAAVIWSARKMSQAQVEAINAVTAKINRSTAEIKKRIDDLESALGNAGVDDPAVTTALASLNAAADANDDIAPPLAGPTDSPTETPSSPA